MAEALKIIGNGSNAALVFGITLRFLGLLAPKKFFGTEFDWTPGTSLAALVFGVIFIIGSLVLRGWC
jgi:hypothetical protein